MVMLSTMAVSNNFEGTEMLGSIGKLLFFLILWFVVGIYAIPEFLKRCRKLMSEETLLIVSLALCFGMVAIAANTGFSAAFGAFIMGSILAENRLSIRCQPNPIPTAIPRRIIQKIMVQAAITAVPPTLTIFLKLNSNPRAKSKKMT